MCMFVCVYVYVHPRVHHGSRVVFAEVSSVCVCVCTCACVRVCEEKLSLCVIARVCVCTFDLNPSFILLNSRHF